MTTAVNDVAEQISSVLSHRTHAEVLEAAATRFAADTSEHVLTVVHDDGLHRHLRFRSPGSSAYWFELVTWPGTLVINGDMGTYVFSRLTDMFEFFRGNRVNAQYWAEKLRSADRATAYSEDVLKQHLADVVAEWVEEQDQDGFAEHFTALLAALREQVLTFSDDEHDVRSALNDFSHPELSLHDTWEWDLSEYTIHFLWSCHAIVWGIARYDEAKAAQV